jgi:phosphoribosylamine---glycine ligase
VRVLVVGSGAREHAIAWTLAAERGFPATPRDGIFCAPGNAGTELVASNLPIDPEDTSAVIAACRELDIGLVVVGPETALAAGLVDALNERGVAAFGPGRNAARLESSKAFAREFAERHGVPTAKTARFADAAAFLAFLDANRGRRIVLKKSGLAAGKGVLESDDRDELASFGEAVLRSDALLAEEYLPGRELSVFALCDGEGHLLLPACADHKKAGAGDTGPNTGGMGAICPVPAASREVMAAIGREIVEPTFRGMASEGLTYRGVLFFGIMLTAEGPKLLEYNVRWGDPETQSLLPLLESSFLDLTRETALGRLASIRPAFAPAQACGVVVAASGYPGPYNKGLEADLGGATPLDSVASAGTEASRGPYPRSFLFHASTTRDPAGGVRTGGGRCFTAVGIGRDWESARDRAYAMAKTVRFDGAWFREDIGEKHHPARG